ncbi:hypothetical protein C8F01DRAFT_1271262 [Mycena amicta]|nr:hypothetical protein C8F01DRAFT_1271262 [Mycena amicta]
MSQSHSPYLPRELERLIFRTAALAAPSEAGHFLVVAWRVKEWVEPLLYRSLVIHSSTHFDTILSAPILKLSPHAFDQLVKRKSQSFFASYVQNLLFYFVSPEDIRRILRVCVGTKSLISQSTASRGVNLLDSLEQLQRLQGALGELFDLKASENSLASLPALSHLTHLEIWDRESTRNPIWAQLLALPALTHLACDSKQWQKLLPDQCNAVLAALRPSGALHAFIVIQYYAGGAPEIDVEPRLRSNPGFVFIRVHQSFPDRRYFSWPDDWSEGILEGNDFWARAEEHIRKRHAGEIGRDQYKLLMPAHQHLY